jgi:preprotein translocase subunit SecG
VFAFFVVIHIIVCVALILTVLLQAGKGGGLAGAFGGGAAQTIFGGRGAATFLSKATSWLAVAFMAMSILLAILSSRGTAREGLLQQRARERAAKAQLPPSTSSFTPGAQDTSGAFTPPGGQAPAVPPATPPARQAAPPTTPPAGQPAPQSKPPAPASKP